MNINAVSLAAPKFQSAKPVRSVNFTGLEKAGNAAGEAATAAANKAGVTDKIVKVLSTIAGGLKAFGQKVLQSFKKLLFGPHEINIGKGNKIIYTVNGKEVSVEEFNGPFKGSPFQSRVLEPFGTNTDSDVFITQTVKKGGLGISYTSQKLASGGKFSITQIGKKTYINGKLYKPGGKLPEGVKFKDGVFCVKDGKRTIIVAQTSE